MNDLFLAQAKSDCFLHGIYWCVLKNDLSDPEMHARPEDVC